MISLLASPKGMYAEGNMPRVCHFGGGLLNLQRSQDIHHPYSHILSAYRAQRVALDCYISNHYWDVVDQHEM